MTKFVESAVDKKFEKKKVFLKNWNAIAVLVYIYNEGSFGRHVSQYNDIHHNDTQHWLSLCWVL